MGRIELQFSDKGVRCQVEKVNTLDMCKALMVLTRNAVEFDIPKELILNAVFMGLSETVYKDIVTDIPLENMSEGVDVRKDVAEILRNRGNNGTDT